MKNVEFPVIIIPKKKTPAPSSQFKKRKTTDTFVPIPVEAEQLSTFSKEDELDVLRTQGSLTQSHTEIARLKNIDYIIVLTLFY